MFGANSPFAQAPPRFRRSASCFIDDKLYFRAGLGLAGAHTGAVYLTLTDTAGAADQLMGASSPVAGMAELHETVDDHGVMRMRPVKGLPLAPGKAMTLKPGGYHIMLMGLKQPLKAGDSFPLTLTFEHAPPVTVQATVKPIGAAAPGGMQGMQGMPGMNHMQGTKP